MNNIKISDFSKHVTKFIFLLFISVSINAETSAPDNEFDHVQSGFMLTGQHTILNCNDCHIRGIFRGTPNTCEGCHDRVSQIAASIKPITHVQTHASCDDCHTDSSWSFVRMDHGDLTGDCYSCHNGVKATGKPVRHVTSSNECDDCHLTIAWIPAGFNHSNVTVPCFTCHNGIDATGKHPTHVTSSNTCDDCHSTHGWIPASFDHIGVTGSCDTCHNGTTATGKSPQHFVTTSQCDSCHTTSFWEPTTAFDHMSAIYPGDHTGSNPACIDCHTSNSQTISWPYPAYQPECAACHANDYNQGEHDNAPISGLIDCSSSSCHEDKPRHSVNQSRWD